MKVLVIPEDQTHDQYVLRPVIEGIFHDLQKPASVSVLPEPRLRGSTDALDPRVIGAIVSENPMVDLFVLVVDRDCDRKKHSERVEQLEASHGSLIACLAVQEIEVWMLALHRDELEKLLKTKWRDIRQDCDPKERFADPFLDQRGSSGPGNGRKAAMREIRGKWRTLLSLCPEIDDLKQRIAARL